MSTPPCRLCGQQKPLTEDHVPPRKISEGEAVLQRGLLDYLGQPHIIRGRTKQNGIKFKTICRTCNSFLGHEFDPELINYANRIKSLYDCLRPDQIRAQLVTTVKPARLARAVVGHMVSGTTQSYLSSFDTAIQSYIFDPDASFPKNMRIYCWAHLFDVTTIARDTVILFIPEDSTVLSHVLKFFPLGFAAVHDGVIPHAQDITYFVNCGIDETQKLLVPIIINDPSWPEKPDEGRAILGGKSFSEGIFAIPKKHAPKRRI